ncbi:glycoside hydrolase family 172 protein [Sphingopyxis sp. 550A]
MDRRDLLKGGLILPAPAALVGQFAADRLAVGDYDVMDASLIDTRLDCRSISFENPTGARGAGGSAAGGRKGRPAQLIRPGERIILADIAGSGTIRHIWATTDGWSPAVLRSLRLEVRYDGLDDPSVSVPFFDFFGQPHGRTREFYSALLSTHESRGLNSHMPMPFHRAIRIDLRNESERHILLYYQIDYTLEPREAVPTSYLHATFRRENPTRLRDDFIIFEGLEGPGRFLGCSVGVRVIDSGSWYGEGEVKIFRDGDQDLPTICGTGLEDYVGTAWGMGPHHGTYSGAPLVMPAPGDAKPDDYRPDLVSFYRWHLPDPIMFEREIKVTIQQIGFAKFGPDQRDEKLQYEAAHPPAGRGWSTVAGTTFGIVERRDDYCATAFVYCSRPQPVSRYDRECALADLEEFPYEPKRELSDDQRDALNRSFLDKAA